MKGEGAEERRAHASGLFHGLRGHLRDTDVIELALGDECLERLELLLDTDLLVNAGELEEVETLLPVERLDDSIDAAPDVLRARVVLEAIGLGPALST